MKALLRMSLGICGFYVISTGTVWGADAVQLPPQVGPTRYIAVEGAAEIRIVPDTLVWDITIRDVHRELSAAKRSNDNRVSTALDIIKGLGVSSEDVQAATISIESQFDRDNDGNKKGIKSYSVNRKISVRQRNIEKFDVLYEALATKTQAEIALGLEHSKIDEVRDEARKSAVRNAHAKAEGMATEAGAKLGKILSLDEFVKPSRYDLDVPIYTKPDGTNMFNNTVTSRLVNVPGLSFATGSTIVRVSIQTRWELLD